MINVTEKIRILWNKGYFEHHRTNKDISNKVWIDFKCKYPNWTVLLGRCEFLVREKLGWVQRYPHNSKIGINIIKIEAGKPREAVKSFECIIKKLKGNLSISDPYLTRDCLDLLERFKKNKIRFLFSKKQSKLGERDIEDFKYEYGNIIFRKYENNHLHDRYIISNNMLLIIGHGLSLRNKETFLILLDDSVAKDLRLSLLQTFDRRWKISKKK